MTISPLQLNFFNRPATRVAKELLGKFLVRRWRGRETALMITEVEAYDGPRDLASHASRGLTPRTKIMFGEASRFYIYFTYGMHWLVNIVAGAKGYPAAVLLRGGIAVHHAPDVPPTPGLWRAGKRQEKVKYISGPARLTKYLKIDKRFNGLAANKKTGLWFEDRGVKIKPRQIIRGKRVGVDYAGRWAKKLYNFKLET